MSLKIRLPSINAPSDREKLEQIRSYLYQLANQLNWLMDNLPAGGVTVRQEEDAYVLFARLRPLIMRSKEILDAYREQMKTTFPLKEELEDLAQTHREDMAGRSYCQVFEAGEDTVLSLRGQENQVFFIAGIQGGAAVSGTAVLCPDGSVLSAGVTAQGASLPLLSGDRLMLLSHAPITI